MPRNIFLLVVLFFLGSAPVGAAEPSVYGLHSSPLTALADEEASRALSQQLTQARPSDVVAFALTIDVVTIRRGEPNPPVRLALVLSDTSLLFAGASLAPIALPAARSTPEVREVAEQFARGLASGKLTGGNRWGYRACEAVLGTDCLNEAGVWVPPAMPKMVRDAANGTLEAAVLTSTSVILRQDDGQLVSLAANWLAPKRRKKPMEPGALSVQPTGRWSEAPPTDHPPDHLDPGWSRWCAHDWTRLVEPARDVSGRCLLQLLSDAYDSPIRGGRIADMMMLDFDPMPPPDESRLSVGKLRSMKSHLAHRCAGPDTTPCGRVMESIEMGIERKSSLFENVALGSFEELLAAALAGEALPADMSAPGRARWSELTLDKLEAAVWAGNGYLVIDPLLSDFFYAERAAGEPGEAVLPLPWPGSRLSGLSETDRANLELIRSKRR
ncbi:MAG: hypothetical protein KDA24_07345 [Deltaproteobacteria bacterium]|nr:hypothetical protein [Deltaproteobacteria bacterium]